TRLPAGRLDDPPECGMPPRSGRHAEEAAMAKVLVLYGKVGSVFTSTATQHGGQETTILSTIVDLLHLGMVIVGLPYSFAGLSTITEISGGTPYGASTITGSNGERMPSRNELEGARFPGARGRRGRAQAARLRASPRTARAG